MTIDAIKKFFGMHVHTFSKWEVTKALSNDRSESVLIQTRHCTECHFTDLKRTEAS